MIQLIGWIGAISLAACGIPQAYLVLKQGHADGYSLRSAQCYWVGELCMLLAVTFGAFSWPLLTNFLINLIASSIILWYKLHPRK